MALHPGGLLLYEVPRRGGRAAVLVRRRLEVREVHGRKVCDKGKPGRVCGEGLGEFLPAAGALEKFFLQSDPEHSIQDVVGKVCAKVPGGMARRTPKQSKKSLGLTEGFHGMVEVRLQGSFAEVF